MSTQTAETDDPPQRSRRLSGWKEISVHFGRGVRTAPQALSPEPALAAAAPTSPTLGRVSWFFLTVAVLVLVAVTLWLAGHAGSPTAVAAIGTPTALAYRAPASWTLDSGRLAVFDADGRELFSHALRIALTGSFSDRSAGALDSPVQFADIDGDGRDEVLLVPPAVDPAAARLYCFEATGALRFAYQPRETVRFGETVYDSPWAVSRFFVTRRSDGSRSLWAVSSHPTQFPSSLKELDPAGHVVREYWSNGRISHVSEYRWHDKDVVLVGASDEDKRGASLAVFGREEVGGSAPARRAGFDCTSCPLGGPREYIVFPRSCLASGPTPVEDAWVGSGDRLTVMTELARVSLDGLAPVGTVVAYYSFDSHLSLVQAEISREFQVAHRGLERRGLVDHAFGRRDDAALFPVLRFDGTRYRALPPVVVGH
jgi:hypothetical protein